VDAGTSPALTAEKRFADEEQTLAVIWPWQDRTRRFSLLKAPGTFGLMFVPAIWLVDRLPAASFGSDPFARRLTYGRALGNRDLLWLWRIKPESAYSLAPAHHSAALIA